MNALRNSLSESHKDLHQWFLFHQECLLLGEDKAASLALEGFKDYLQVHLGFENNEILPRVQTQEQQLQWRISVYQAEHEKLIIQLNKLEVMVDDYRKMSGREKRLALLELIDKEMSFYHLLEHHEEREEKDLFLQFDSLDSSVEAQWQEIEADLHDRRKSDKEYLKSLLSTVY